MGLANPSEVDRENGHRSRRHCRHSRSGRVRVRTVCDRERDAGSNAAGQAWFLRSKPAALEERYYMLHLIHGSQHRQRLDRHAYSAAQPDARLERRLDQDWSG